MNNHNQSTDAIADLIAKRAQEISVPDGSLIAVRRRANQRRARQRASAGATGLALLGGAVGLVQIRANRTTSSTMRENPGDVDSSLTIPPSTQPVVVIHTDSTIENTSHFVTPLEIGSTGVPVVALQQRLKELAFDPGPIDGFFGTGTRQALWAFETLVLGIPLAEATGELTDEMWQVMQHPIDIKPRRSTTQIYGQRPTHVEIYLPEQVAIVFTDDKPVLITHISSGSGEAWCDVVKYSVESVASPTAKPFVRDECGESRTPGGVFAFYLRYEGNQVGPLGNMWNPVFFNYDIAVHGDDDVPLNPESRGGIRIPMFIAEYFPGLVEDKDRVYVWDGIREPEEYTKEEKVPPANYPNPNATTSTAD